jgi:AraC-like DNA-binding protein
MACFEAGADNGLVKPFNSGELRLVAEHLINQRSIIRDRMYQSRHDASRESRPEPMSKEDQQLISKLVEVIHAQMANDDIDMEHIAAALSLSPKQLRTRVMDITGMTLVAYVLQVRLNYARRLIPNESLSLTAISSKCGFQNLSYFSKTFKQQFGVSPQQYRKGMDDIAMALPKSNS